MSKLKNKANKTKNPLDIMNYKKQRNYVTKLNKTAKLEYFNNLKLGKDNKPFWEKCKPYFTNKHSKADTDIMLNENGELLLKDKDIADTFNEYFGSIVESLDLYKWESEITDLGLNDSDQDYLDITIRKYEKYPKERRKPLSFLYILIGTCYCKCNWSIWHPSRKRKQGSIFCIFYIYLPSFVYTYLPFYKQPIYNINHQIMIYNYVNAPPPPPAPPDFCKS